jgi:hypothetical protein
MATVRELEKQVKALQSALERAGIRSPVEPAQRPEDRADYIAPGSPEHAIFLGLVEVKDVEQAEAGGYTVYTSPSTSVVWRLEDETRPLSLYPGMDPEKAIRAVLRQKVSAFESGKPEIPDYAPPMWVPIDQPTG